MFAAVGREGAERVFRNPHTEQSVGRLEIGPKTHLVDRHVYKAPSRARGSGRGGVYFVVTSQGPWPAVLAYRQAVLRAVTVSSVFHPYSGMYFVVAQTTYMDAVW
ncbi:hypothetical protein EVAR_96673_1 [Eumeta japonica]|uniref:Uncharacterized protein n=1 Tax=Eumeta variegata TaxID=151549 RepID=A0A4C1WJU4_EUMVA|nr:hypothetical protein EVAR_96673_1 [Eumeta japonica]